ncbi:MAG: hypothetical protein QXW71_05425 [Thermoplasmata archaeon]
MKESFLIFTGNVLIVGLALFIVKKYIESLIFGPKNKTQFMTKEEVLKMIEEHKHFCREAYLQHVIARLDKVEETLTETQELTREIKERLIALETKISISLKNGGK